jgi:hypothetical protein
MDNSINRSPRAILVAIMASAFALACSGGQGPNPLEDGPLAGAPSWVLQGCSAYWGDDDGTRVCGVGSVSGTRNISLARTAAIGRARTEIARSLETRVKAMLKDYQATTTGGDEFGRGAADEQYIEDVSKQISQTTLVGTTLQDTWVANEGSLYVLVAMDVEAFSDAINEMTNLSETIRQAVQTRAKASFEELDEATR